MLYTCNEPTAALFEAIFKVLRYGTFAAVEQTLSSEEHQSRCRYVCDGLQESENRGLDGLLTLLSVTEALLTSVPFWCCVSLPHAKGRVTSNGIIKFLSICLYFLCVLFNVQILIWILKSCKLFDTPLYFFFLCLFRSQFLWLWWHLKW